MASEKRPLIYVVRDIERAAAMEPTVHYRIVTNRTPYAETIKKHYPDFVHLVEPSPHTLDTPELLEDQGVMRIIDDAKADILVFKNNSRIEAIAKENGWHLLNPSAALAERVENKVSQAEWLSDLAKEYLPEYTIAPAKDIRWDKKPLIIQWAHGHSGLGTMLVNSDNELKTIQKQFPDREARTAEFISGPTFTLSVIATEGKTLIGNINYQITGLPPFTNKPFSTVGNDWSLTHSLLSHEEVAYVEEMAKKIGDRLSADGWRGLFGIDVIRDEERGRICLIEINARQPAGASFESILQQRFRREGIAGITTFEAHVKAVCGELIDQELIPINDGAQIIQRVTKACKGIDADDIGSLESAGYTVIAYPNTEENADLIRIQSMKGIMETHAKLNARGKEILETIHGESE